MTESEFAAIVGKTKRIVLAAVRKHLAVRFSFAIDDVVQETYLRGYRHLAGGRFREESSIESWLYAIARNESLRMNKKLMREEEKTRKAADERQLAMNTGPVAEDAISLELLIGRLPEKYRAVMTLKAQGLSERDIADTLGITTGTVKSRFSRGKEMLQKLSGEVV
ncbi:MAG TPA: RNA polymerase sigma factor [Spirochaetota bacterium]|nr:RNA polymerase sigma factor [Spirochaetota bacterium]HPC42719.1 RNA polymerase sigma factor [Spirochaetota bacterium]HPL16384.1 RNA polymerase sigma factor [Spirochaetota bacterium]HQF08343.1 RNA polymerase sigma factor [Spirochaetota bacterium]HQH98980.1 RNA polymerase sigma factor [Spirochaetota bacterium]